MFIGYKLTKKICKKQSYPFFEISKKELVKLNKNSLSFYFMWTDKPIINAYTVDYGYRGKIRKFVKHPEKNLKIKIHDFKNVKAIGISGLIYTYYGCTNRIVCEFID